MPSASPSTFAAARPLVRGRRCFGPGAPQVGLALIARTDLGAAHAAALAEVLPLLGCSEEAAAMAFAGLAAREADPAAAAALDRIGAEERVHDGLIAGLAAGLPAPRDAPGWMRAARRFHVRLGRGSAAEHLARVAAIDAAVCTILARLTRRGAPIASDAASFGVLSRIHADEARHVRVSRGLAMARADTRALAEVAASARGALADVLSVAGDAFEVLGVDAGALLADIRVLPDGLLRA